MAIDSERIELLLALALAFNRREQDLDSRDEPDGAVEDDASAAGVMTPNFNQQEFLVGLRVTERQAAQRCFEWYEKLESGERERWLLRTLNRARRRNELTYLDEHIHPSHIIEVLGSEPARVRALVLNHLPPSLSASCAQLLGGAIERDFSQTLTAEKAPAPEIVDIVRRSFQKHFATLSDIQHPTALDLLTGVELARLMRLLGVRETALACRGIPQMETVTAFLRRFTAEDARAITAQIAALANVAAPRVSHAEEIVHDALQHEAEAGAMLNRAGLKLLSIALSGDTDARLRYSAQKLPVEVAKALSEAVAAQRESLTGGEMQSLIAAETEALAASLRRLLGNERPPAVL